VLRVLLSDETRNHAVAMTSRITINPLSNFNQIGEFWFDIIYYITFLRFLLVHNEDSSHPPGSDGILSPPV
jgi:hypothetical protein